jgi:hypothetical protein
MLLRTMHIKEVTASRRSERLPFAGWRSDYDLPSGRQRSWRTRSGIERGSAFSL